MARQRDATIPYEVNVDGETIKLMCAVVPYDERDWLIAGEPDFQVYAWSGSSSYAGLTPDEDREVVAIWLSSMAIEEPSAPNFEDKVIRVTEQLSLIGW